MGIDIGAISASYTDSNITNWNDFVRAVIATGQTLTDTSGKHIWSVDSESNSNEWLNLTGAEISLTGASVSISGAEWSTVGLGTGISGIDGGYSIAGQIATVAKAEDKAMGQNGVACFFATLGLSLVS
jgi:hypothetical protein